MSCPHPAHSPSCSEDAPSRIEVEIPATTAPRIRPLLPHEIARVDFEHTLQLVNKLIAAAPEAAAQFHAALERPLDGQIRELREESPSVVFRSPLRVDATEGHAPRTVASDTMTYRSTGQTLPFEHGGTTEPIHIYEHVA